MQLKRSIQQTLCPSLRDSAVRYLRSHPEKRQMFPQKLLEKLLKPAEEEKFEHCESCLYGINPDTVVQKEDF